MLDGRNNSTTPTVSQHQHLTRPVKAFITLVALAMSGFAVGVVAPASAEPSIDSVKEKVDRLYHEAEIASERYNTAKVRMEAARTQLNALDVDLDTQQARVDRMRGDVAALVVAQYQGQALSTASQLALADDPDAFLDDLNAVTAYNSQRAEVLDSYGEELERLELRQAAVKTETRSLAGVARDMAEQKATIEEKVAAAEEELSTLEAEAREQLMEQDTAEAPAPASVPASGRAGAAVQFALAQVGKAYVYGAAGPSAYDCSGLTMAAWAQAGVGLPHSSGAQMGSGRQVSQSELQPGDLVFYYSPVSHVGMYIGNGMIVDAANPGTGVRTAPVNSMPYSGAVRPG